MNVLKNEIERFKKSKYTTVFLGDSKERVEKLASVLSDYDIEAAQADQDAALAQGQIYIMEGGLQSGFEPSDDQAGRYHGGRACLKSVSKSRRANKN